MTHRRAPQPRRLTPYERAWLGAAVVGAWLLMPVWHGLDAAWKLGERRGWW